MQKTMFLCCVGKRNYFVSITVGTEKWKSDLCSKFLQL